MSNFWGKAPSSRPINAQVIQLSSAAAVNSASFGSETYQIRVISNIATWASIDGVPTAAVQTAGSFYLPANTSVGEYFTVTPGQQISLISLSSATTGTVSVTEMA